MLASFIGVQSQKNRERDFSRGKPLHYILVGLIVTVVFILVIRGVVKLVLSAVARITRAKENGMSRITLNETLITDYALEL